MRALDCVGGFGRHIVFVVLCQHLGSFEHPVRAQPALRHHTFAYIAMLARKTGRMWDQGVGTRMDSTLGRAMQRITVILGLIAIFALAWRRRWWEFWVYAIPIGLVTAVGAVSLASTRRNEVLMSLVIPLAAAALVWAWELAERRLGEPASV